MDGSDEAINFITRMERLGLSLVSCVQPGVLSSVFIKVEWVAVKLFIRTAQDASWKAFELEETSEKLLDNVNTTC